MTKQKRRRGLPRGDAKDLHLPNTKLDNGAEPKAQDIFVDNRVGGRVVYGAHGVLIFLRTEEGYQQVGGIFKNDDEAFAAFREARYDLGF